MRFATERSFGCKTNAQRKRFTSDLLGTGEMVLERTQPNSDCVRSSIQSIRWDRNEARFVLVGCSDGGLPLFDSHRLAEPLAIVRRGPSHHTMGVCVADWYCVDNGVFNVGSFDGSVGVWDTNAMECVHLYRVSDCINVIASGNTEHTAPLILCGTKSDYLRLLDIRQEANTHCLMGHREQVTSVAWSNTNPFHLVTADVEGCCFIWDLRRPSPMIELGSAVAPQVRGSMARSLTAGTGNVFKQRKRSRSSLKLDDPRLERAASAAVERSAGVVLKSASSSSAHRDSVNSVCFSGDGRFLVTYSLRDCMKVWDVHGNWSLVRSVDVLDGPASHPLMRLDMAVSEDPFDVSNRVLLGSGLDMCAVPLGGGELVWWPGHSMTISTVQYNSRTHQAMSGGQDGVLRLWRHRDVADNVAGAAAAAAEHDDWSE